MTSEKFPAAISLNVRNGFTASRCKLANDGRPPYGFTGPAGYSHAGADGAVRNVGRERGRTHRASPQRAAREDQ